MKSIVRSLWCRAIAKMLVFAMAVPLGLAPAAGAQRSAAVLVAPLENKTPTGGDELAQRVTHAIKTALDASGRAAVVSTSETSPSVKRAIEQGRKISADDVRPPWDADKARRVGRELGADIALLGTIDEYAYDEGAKRVTISLSIQRLDVSTEDPPVSIGVTGRSADKPRPPAKEGTLMAEALDDAAVKVAEAVVGGGVVVKPAAKEKPARQGKKKNRWLIPLLAVVAVVAIASGGGGGPSGPARVTSPISDALATPTASDLALSWGVKDTVVPEGFNIYRAPAGTATLGGEDVISRAPRRSRQAVAGPYEKIANLLGTARGSTDTNAALGQLYAYQIRAVIKGKESNPADFNNRYELPTLNVVVGPGVPIAPRGVNIGRGPGSLSVTVRWQLNPETFVTGYRVYRGTSPGALYLLGEFPATATQHNDFRNLEANRTYYYLVTALGAMVGTRPIESGTGPIPFTVVPGPLAPPTNLQAAGGHNNVVLSWTPSLDEAVLGYNVYRDGVKVGTATPRIQSTHADTGLQPGVTYSYFLRSFDANVTESANSNVVTARTTLPPSSLTAKAEPATLLANGVDQSTISATVKDSAGRAVAGVTVVFQRTQGDGTLQVAPGSGGSGSDPTIEAPTDSAGVARALLKAPTTVPSGPTTIRATVKNTGIFGETQVTIIAPTPASITVVASPTDVIADGTSQSTVTATVKDASGQGVVGVNVHFTISNPSLGVLSASDKITGAQGRAIVNVRSAAINAIGSAQVTASAGGKSAYVMLNFIAQPSLTVSVNPTTIPAGGIGSTALITATVKKSDGSPLAGQKVYFGFDLAGAPTTSTTGATIAPAFSNSDTAGLAFSTLTSPPNLNTGDADVVLVWLDTNASGAFEMGADRWAIAGITYTEPPASVTVAASPASLPADETSTTRITADVRTAIPNPAGPGNKPVADGTVVNFSTSDGVFASTGTDSATGRTVNGLATVFLRASDQPGTVTVTATAASVSGSTQVQFTPVAARILTVTADPGAISANGTARSTITAYLRENDGTPVVDESVTFSTTLGTLSPTQAVTASNGRATTTLTAGREAGTAAVAASAGDLAATVHVSFTGGAPARVDLAQAVPWIIAATGGLSSESGAPIQTVVRAQVTDEFGNPVQDGTTVLFHTDIGLITASVPTVNGGATATLVASTFETATNAATFRPGVASVRAWGGSLTGPTDGPLHPIFAGDLARYTLSGADTATNLYTLSGADWRTDAVGGFGTAPNLSPTAGSRIRAFLILRDANDNPLPLGVPVQWFVCYGGVCPRFEGTATTFNLNDETRIVFEFQPTVLSETPMSKVLATITVETPGISSTLHVIMSVGQWIGATNATTISPPPESPECLLNSTCSCGMTVQFQDIKDEFGNFVQDGTPVTFSWENATNLEAINLIPSQGASVGGRASVLVTGRTTRDPQDLCMDGTVTVIATPSTTVTPPPTASVSVNFNAP